MKNLFLSAALAMNADKLNQMPAFAKADQQPADDTIQEKLFFESLDESIMLDSLAAVSEADLRAQALASVIIFADEAMNTADELDSLAVGIADVNEDGEVTDDEAEAYEEALNALAEALAHVGVSSALIEKALADGDDEAAESISQFVADYLDDVADEDKLIADYSVREQVMLEAVKKVIRDGQVKWIKKPLRKRRMSAAQRAALKKARRKANTGAAKAARRKAMRMRKSRGM